VTKQNELNALHHCLAGSLPNRPSR